MDKFLIKDELKTVASSTMLTALTTPDDNIIDTVIIENIALFKSYLQGGYDVEAIFSTRGEHRSPVVLKYLKDLVIHDLYARQERVHMADSVRTRYKEALNWLESIGQGSLSPDLPVRNRQIDPNLSSEPTYRSKF